SMIGLIFIAIAKPTPRIIEIVKPIKITTNVVGRWLKNNSVLNSHNLTPIPMGDGRINIILITLATISHKPSIIIIKIIEGKYFFIMIPSVVDDQLTDFLNRSCKHH